MRKSQLRKLKKDAEQAWQDWHNAERTPEAIRDEYARLPDSIEWAEEKLATLRIREGEERAALTKPLEEYARTRDGEFYHDGAQTVALLQKRIGWMEKDLERQRKKLAEGLKPKIEAAEKRIEKRKARFEYLASQLCQYAVFYARQRSDVDPVWTEEDEGEWTFDGRIALWVNGEAKAWRIKNLILYLLEKHTSASDGDGEEPVREVQARERGNDEYMILSSDLYNAMRGLPTNAYVDIEGCTLQVKSLRAYLRLVDGPMWVTLGTAHETNDETGYRETIRVESEPEGLRWSSTVWKNKLHTPNAQVEIRA